MLETIIFLILGIYTCVLIYKYPEETIKLKYKLKKSFNLANNPNDIFYSNDEELYKNRCEKMLRRARRGMILLGLMAGFLVLSTLYHMIKWSLLSGM